MIQVENAKKIVELVSSLSSKQNESLISQAQKLQSNCSNLVKKFNYLLKPADIPLLHEKLKEEFARRYHFESLLEFKEKELSKMIATENIKRTNFLSEHKLNLSSNALTQLLIDCSIKFSIDRNSNVPKVSDISTDDTASIQKEYRKEARYKEKIQLLNDEVKAMKAELKLKNEELLKANNQRANEIERINRDLSTNISYYKDIVEEIVQERRKEIDHLATIIKSPIVLENFTGDLKSSQDVIQSLKNTIANKSSSIDFLENKVIGLNRVISGLTTANFNMMSARISEVKSKVDHYESLYNKELIDKQNLENAFKTLEIEKLKTEKDLKDSLSSYTKTLSELHFVKSENKKLAQQSAEKNKLKDVEAKMKKYKELAENAESSLKDIILQNSGLRTTIDQLKSANEKLAKEKDETLKTCLDMVNQKYDEGETKDSDDSEKYKTENSRLKKENEEHISLITDLQIEVSEYKNENNKLKSKLDNLWENDNKSGSKELESLMREVQTLRAEKLKWSTANDTNSFVRNEGVSLGLLSEGQKRIFIKDQTSETSRYFPLILELPEGDESMSDPNKTRIIKRKMQDKIFLNTPSLKSNIQTLLSNFNMIVVAEIQDIEENYAESDVDELSVAEGESYCLCNIKTIDHLGYFINQEFCQITFYQPSI